MASSILIRSDAGVVKVVVVVVVVVAVVVVVVPFPHHAMVEDDHDDDHSKDDDDDDDDDDNDSFRNDRNESFPRYRSQKSVGGFRYQAPTTTRITIDETATLVDDKNLRIRRRFLSLEALEGSCGSDFSGVVKGSLILVSLRLYWCS